MKSTSFSSSGEASTGPLPATSLAAAGDARRGRPATGSSCRSAGVSTSSTRTTPMPIGPPRMPPPKPPWPRRSSMFSRLPDVHFMTAPPRQGGTDPARASILTRNRASRPRQTAPEVAVARRRDPLSLGGDTTSRPAAEPRSRGFAQAVALRHARFTGPPGACGGDGDRGRRRAGAVPRLDVLGSARQRPAVRRRLGGRVGWRARCCVCAL